MILDIGEMKIEDADDANIPVDIWLNRVSDPSDHQSLVNGTYDPDDNESTPPEVNTEWWQLTAHNYMPRKGVVTDDRVFTAVSPKREELAELVREHWLPLYSGAVKKLEKMIKGKVDNLYYWDKE